MPDHLHFILQGMEDRADAWQAVVQFKQQTGYWLFRNLPEITWQKDFHDHIIRRGEDLGAHVRYIAANPERSGLVQHWQDHPYTGAIGADLQTIMADAATL